MLINLKRRLLKLEKRNSDLIKKISWLEKRVTDLETGNFHLLRVFQRSMEKMRKLSRQRFLKIYKN